jgi:hypothetical protein
MKKIPSVTTLFLGMGIAAFLFAGCEQTSGPSDSGDKASGESAKSKKDQIVTLPGHMEEGTADDSTETGTWTEADWDKAHSQPMQPYDPSQVRTLPGHVRCPGPDSSATVPPDDALVTSDTPDGCLKDGPFSGEVVCHLPRQ